MKPPIRSVLIFFALIVLAASASAQADEICGEVGLRPTMDSPGEKVPYVYGRIILKGHDPSAKFPKVTVGFLDAQRSQGRLTVYKSGNYCFRRSSGGGGTIIIEVEGVETARRSLSSLGPLQQREDFEIYLTQLQRSVPPGVVSAKFSRPQNEKTVGLYRQTAEAERDKKLDKAVKYGKEIVSIDPADFIAWAKLGSLYFEQNSLSDAESAFKRSLELKPEYTPALINFGTLRAVQKQFDAAIELFKQAIATDATSARSYRLMGEAYLQIRKGTLGLEALNEAIKLDPIGQAECHLLIARLYDLAGAKNLASHEYKIFLTKVPNHPDKKKFEQYIKENPEVREKP